MWDKWVSQLNEWRKWGFPRVSVWRDHTLVLCESILKYIHFFTSLLYFQMKPWGLGILGGNQRCKDMRCHGAYTEKETFQRKDPTPLFIHPFFFSLSSDYWEYNLSAEEESELQKGKWTSRFWGKAQGKAGMSKKKREDGVGVASASSDPVFRLQTLPSGITQPKISFELVWHA